MIEFFSTAGAGGTTTEVRIPKQASGSGPEQTSRFTFEDPLSKTEGYRVGVIVGQ